MIVGLISKVFQSQTLDDRFLDGQTDVGITVHGTCRLVSNDFGDPNLMFL